MIVADTDEQRREALAQILPMQKNDFREIFRIMEGLPVTVRLPTRRCTNFCPRGVANRRLGGLCVESST